MNYPRSFFFSTFWLAFTLVVALTLFVGWALWRPR